MPPATAYCLTPYNKLQAFTRRNQKPQKWSCAWGKQKARSKVPSVSSVQATAENLWSENRPRHFSSFQSCGETVHKTTEVAFLPSPSLKPGEKKCVLLPYAPECAQSAPAGCTGGAEICRADTTCANLLCRALLPRGMLCPCPLLLWGFLGARNDVGAAAGSAMPEAACWQPLACCCVAGGWSHAIVCSEEEFRIPAPLWSVNTFVLVLVVTSMIKGGIWRQTKCLWKSNLMKREKKRRTKKSLINGLVSGPRDRYTESCHDSFLFTSHFDARSLCCGRAWWVYAMCTQALCQRWQEGGCRAMCCLAVSPPLDFSERICKGMGAGPL